MTLWRVEWLRLLRTRRWIVLLAVYALFGALGPVTARYLAEILAQVGGVQVVLPEPTAADGIGTYVDNVSQLGLLAVLVIAAGALALDAHPERAAFYRTRVDSVRRLLIPRAAVPAISAAGAFAVGMAVAWPLTAALLGPVPAAAVLLGTVLEGLYLAFAVAAAAAVGGLVRSAVGIVLGTVVLLLLLPAVGLIPGAAPWLPSELVGAPAQIAAGGAASDHLRSAAVTLLAIPALFAFSVRRYGSREI